MPADNPIDRLLQASSVHHDWHDILASALQTVDRHYLQDLLDQPGWLPGRQQIFRAFQRDRSHCRYILFGESPYPRAQSANGIAFYDAAVDALWSDKGLSKGVNRATSLRNIIKTALLAEGLITPDGAGKITQPMIADLEKTNLISNIHELFDAMQQRGFLLFNATPVLHPTRKPLAEVKFWQDFIEQLLAAIAASSPAIPTLVLWGKIAQQIQAIDVAGAFPQMVSEHPYNISFIHNHQMQRLFAQLRLLHRANT